MLMLSVVLRIINIVPLFVFILSGLVWFAADSTMAPRICLDTEPSEHHSDAPPALQYHEPSFQLKLHQSIDWLRDLQ